MRNGFQLIMVKTGHLKDELYRKKGYFIIIRLLWKNQKEESWIINLFFLVGKVRGDFRVMTFNRLGLEMEAKLICGATGNGYDSSAYPLRIFQSFIQLIADAFPGERAPADAGLDIVVNHKTAVWAS